MTALGFGITDEQLDRATPEELRQVAAKLQSKANEKQQRDVSEAPSPYFSQFVNALWNDAHTYKEAYEESDEMQSSTRQALKKVHAEKAISTYEFNAAISLLGIKDAAIGNQERVIDRFIRDIEIRAREYGVKLKRAEQPKVEMFVLRG